MPSELFNTSIGHTTNGYKVILSYEADDQVTKYAEIDVMDGDLDVKLPVELTSFPTLQGHNIADHIYRMPIEITMRGEFADNGLKSYGWVGEDRLTKIQDEFEKCQRTGTKFKIITIKNDDAINDSNRRYKSRENMVLISITWTQHQHTLSFIFTFKEAISTFIEIGKAIPAIIDPTLPAITDLSAASLVGELISKEEVIKMTIDALKNIGMINDATIGRCLNSASIALSISWATIGLLSGLTAASVAIPFVGWVIGIGAVIAGAIATGINASMANARNEQIAKYNALGRNFCITDDMTESEKDAVVQKFASFLAEVENTIDVVLSDIAVYRIAKADRQQCTLTVNGTYYVIEIERNADDASYSMTAYYLGVDKVKYLPKVTALETFAGCTDSPSSYFFHDGKYGIRGSTYRVYIVSRSAYVNEAKGIQTNEDKLQEYIQTDYEKYNAEKENLLDFAFVVSPYELTTLTDKVADAIKKALG